MPYQPPPHAPLGERGRLIQCIRILMDLVGTPYNGEAVNASGRIKHILNSRKLDWDQIIPPDLFVSVQQHDRHTSYTRTHSPNTHKRKPPEPDKEVIDLINGCRKHEHFLTEWERDEFLPSISIQINEGGRLTVKQRDILNRIANKLKKHGLWDDVQHEEAF